MTFVYKNNSSWSELTGEYFGYTYKITHYDGTSKKNKYSIWIKTKMHGVQEEIVYKYNLKHTTHNDFWAGRFANYSDLDNQIERIKNIICDIERVNIDKTYGLDSQKFKECQEEFQTL